MVAQKIPIEPVTRIEGHAKVTIHMNGEGQVDHAYLHVNEFRGFEKFCEGRMYFEMPRITPRICGICPVSHHLAAAKAGDALTGAIPPRPASLLRELMHMGQIIQSHGMHFFELAGDLTVEVEFIVTEDEARQLMDRVRDTKQRVFYASVPAEFGIIEGEP